MEGKYGDCSADNIGSSFSKQEYRQPFPSAHCFNLHGTRKAVWLNPTCHKLRRITLRAGRLTPAASVEVAVSTSSAPDLKPDSIVCLSSVVRPAW